MNNQKKIAVMVVPATGFEKINYFTIIFIIKKNLIKLKFRPFQSCRLCYG